MITFFFFLGVRAEGERQRRGGGGVETRSTFSRRQLININANDDGAAAGGRLKLVCKGTHIPCNMVAK